MDAPPIQYCRTDDGVSIAWWSVGAGPPLLYLPQFGLHHAARAWEVPAFNAFIERITQHRRVVSYDYRGTGLSDRAAVDVSIEARLADVDAERPMSLRSMSLRRGIAP